MRRGMQANGESSNRGPITQLCPIAASSVIAEDAPEERCYRPFDRNHEGVHWLGSTCSCGGYVIHPLKGDARHFAVTS